MGRTQIRLSQILNTEQYMENEAEQSTTSTTFSNATSLSLDSTGMNYLIFASLEGLSTVDKQYLEVRLMIDGSTEANNIILAQKEVGLWSPFSTFKMTGLLPGPRIIQLQFRSGDGSLVKVRRARIFVLELN